MEPRCCHVVCIPRLQNVAKTICPLPQRRPGYLAAACIYRRLFELQIRTRVLAACCELQSRAAALVAERSQDIQSAVLWVEMRDRSHGDPATTSAAPATAEPEAALLTPPNEQGSQSSLTLPFAPQRADLNNQVQLQDRAVDLTTVQNSDRRRKRSRLTDAATVAQTCQQQQQLQIRKRKSHTPPPQQTLRRSIRQRVTSRSF